MTAGNMRLLSGGPEAVLEIAIPRTPRSARPLRPTVIMPVLKARQFET